MLTCKSCGKPLDLATSVCPFCGAEVPLGRLAEMLGIICSSCSAYNDAGTRTCIACGKSIADTASPASPPAAAVAPPPATAAPVLASPPPPSPPLPLSTPTARLFVERGEAPAGTAYDLTGACVQVGSAQGQILFPADPFLAPLHATFVLRDQALRLKDEGAAGGIYIRLRGLSIPLRPGALFALGDRLLRFAGALPPAPHTTAPDGTRRLGSPRPEGPAVSIEEWLEGGGAGRTYLRTGSSITLGRAGCSINLGDDPFISQIHAEITLGQDGLPRLRDLGSANGTFIRIPPGTERELSDGDRLRMGREILRVALERPPEGDKP